MLDPSVAEFVFRCRECGEAADFLAEGREVTATTLKIDGIDRVVQHYADTYLCEEHALRVILSNDRPRHLEMLPHFRAATDKLRAAGRAQARADLKAAQTTFGADWGRRR